MRLLPYSCVVMHSAYGASVALCSYRCALPEDGCTYVGRGAMMRSFCVGGCGFTLLARFLRQGLDVWNHMATVRVGFCASLLAGAFWLGCCVCLYAMIARCWLGHSGCVPTAGTVWLQSFAHSVCIEMILARSSSDPIFTR